MAELVLGVISVALAWRSILEVCTFVTDILKDSDDERDELRLQADIALIEFKDWGEYCGVENNNGAYSAFDLKKKDIIDKVMKKQMDSASKILKLLAKYPQVQTSVPDDPDAIRRAATRCRKQLRLSKERLRWNASDRKAVVAFVKDLESQAKRLHRLTRYCSGVSSDPTPPVLNVTPEKISKGLQEIIVLLKSSGSYSETTDQDAKTLHAAIETCLVAVVPSTLWERVNLYAMKASSKLVDHRIGDKMTTWWSDPTSSFLLIDTPVDLECETSLLSSAAFYTCIEQPKMIYIRDIWTPSAPMQTFCDMIACLLHQAVHYCVTFGRNISVPENYGEFADYDYSLSNVVQGMKVFQNLMTQIASSEISITLAIEGLELVVTDPLSSEACDIFFDVLQRVKEEVSMHKSMLKVLFVCPGRGKLWPDCNQKISFLDALDESGQTSNLLDDLRLRL